MKQPFKDRVSDFFAGKGFYIVLFLCVAAIGISGYYLLGVLQDPGQTVSGTIQVTVTPTVPEHSAAQKDAQTTPAAVKPFAAHTPPPIVFSIKITTPLFR